MGLAATSAVDAPFGQSGGAGGGISSLVSGSIGHNAEGTGLWRGGPTWVGERGPEIVGLSAPASVAPNAAAFDGGQREGDGARPAGVPLQRRPPSPQAFGEPGAIAAVLARAPPQGARKGREWGTRR